MLFRSQDAFFALYTKIDPTILPTPAGMPEAAKPPVTGDAKLAEEIEKALKEMTPPTNVNYAVTA